VRDIAQVRKRDGRLVSFDTTKITNAIWAAAQAVGGKDRQKAEELAQAAVTALCCKRQPGAIPTVEEIQDLVEKVLIEGGHARTAKAYILYREQHKNIREVTRLLRDIHIVDDYLDGADWRVQENSNMTFSLQGLNVHITQKVVSNYWLSSIYPREVRDAHLEGDIHLHDLGTLGPYCVGWDLQDLLLEGFRGVRGKTESQPPKHFDVALMQIVNFLYTLQGEAAGAQAFSNFDTLLAPFIAADGLTEREVRQGVQKFLFNMNVPTRVGFQTPFTNVTLDLMPPSFLKNEPAIIGGRATEAVYGDFQREMDMLNRAFAETMSEGDASGRPFTFPIPTYNVTPDFPWDRPALDPVWRMTAKYGIPYFANFVGSDMRPEDVRSMCCRLRLDKRELAKRGGGLFGSNPLTGSVGVVTINLPRLGYRARDIDELEDLLGGVMDLARDSLEIKRSVLERFTERGLYPYSTFYLRGVKQSTGAYWHNHFSTIGVIGMNDALLNLVGQDISTRTGADLARRVLGYMRERLLAFQTQTGNLFNLEATPAEGATYRLAMLDRRRYPDLRMACQENGGAAEAAYYTNSTQLPVGHTDDLFRALDQQDELQCLYTGGTVFHCFIGESLPDPEATRELVRAVAARYKLPYYTITPTFSVCPSHGYLTGAHETCPDCGSGCEVWSRSVGYLRPVDQWNTGKRQEFRDRTTYTRVGAADAVPSTASANGGSHRQGRRLPPG
jgi:ribonucleoside-triphosphate reductase